MSDLENLVPAGKKWWHRNGNEYQVAFLDGEYAACTRASDTRMIRVPLSVLLDKDVFSDVGPAEHQWGVGIYDYRVTFVATNGRQCWIAQWKRKGESRWKERGISNYDMAAEIARLRGLVPPGKEEEKG